MYETYGLLIGGTWRKTGGAGVIEVTDPATGEVGDVGPLLTDRTRLVAVTGASNLIGTRPDVPAIAAAAHAVGALVHVDAVHHTAHAAPDITAMGADLLVVGHARGRSWLQRWWQGCLPKALLDRAPCDVLVVMTK